MRNVFLILVIVLFGITLVLAHDNDNALQQGYCRENSNYGGFCVKTVSLEACIQASENFPLLTAIQWKLSDHQCALLQYSSSAPIECPIGFSSRRGNFDGTITQYTADGDPNFLCMVKQQHTDCPPFPSECGQIKNGETGFNKLLINGELKDVYCDFDISGGPWTIPEILPVPSGTMSKQKYIDYCAANGYPDAGVGVENSNAWLAQKQMLHHTNNPLKQQGFPDGGGARLAMPMWKPSSVLMTLKDKVVNLPPNRLGDYCQSVNQPLCGYWWNSGWSDPDPNVYPDPSDWATSDTMHDLSCMFGREVVPIGDKCLTEHNVNLIRQNLSVVYEPKTEIMRISFDTPIGGQNTSLTVISTSGTSCEVANTNGLPSGTLGDVFCNNDIDGGGWTHFLSDIGPLHKSTLRYGANPGGFGDISVITGSAKMSESRFDDFEFTEILSQTDSGWIKSVHPDGSPFTSVQVFSVSSDDVNMINNKGGSAIERCVGQTSRSCTEYGPLFNDPYGRSYEWLWTDKTGINDGRKGNIPGVSGNSNWRWYGRHSGRHSGNHHNFVFNKTTEDGVTTYSSKISYDIIRESLNNNIAVWNMSLNLDDKHFWKIPVKIEMGNNSISSMDMVVAGMEVSPPVTVQYKGKTGLVCTDKSDYTGTKSQFMMGSNIYCEVSPKETFFKVSDIESVSFAGTEIRHITKSPNGDNMRFSFIPNVGMGSLRVVSSIVYKNGDNSGRRLLSLDISETSISSLMMNVFEKPLGILSIPVFALACTCAILGTLVGSKYSNIFRKPTMV